jgi:hypothetical protein
VPQKDATPFQKGSDGGYLPGDSAPKREVTVGPRGLLRPSGGLLHPSGGYYALPGGSDTLPRAYYGGFKGLLRWGKGEVTPFPGESDALPRAYYGGSKGLLRWVIRKMLRWVGPHSGLCYQHKALHPASLAPAGAGERRKGQSGRHLAAFRYGIMFSSHDNQPLGNAIFRPATGKNRVLLALAKHPILRSIIFWYDSRTILEI